MRIFEKRAFVLFVCATLVTLLVTAPASLLDTCLQYLSRGRMVLANTNGTIWSGSATPALRQQEGRFITLQPLHWRIAVLSIFSGKVQAQLQWDELPSTPAMEVTASFGQIELRHVRIPLPVRVVGELSPILKPAGFRGQLQVQSEHLVFSARGFDGVATVDWQQAGSALSRIAPLGDYRLTLRGAGEQVNIELTTTSGVLLLQGQGGWSAANGLSFHGKAQASREDHGELAELLQHLGPEQSPGVHGFNLTPQ